MSRPDRLVATAVTTAAAVLVGTLAAVAVHELTHVLVDVALTGELSTYANGTPFRIDDSGRIRVWAAAPQGVLALLGPVAGASLGAALMTAGYALHRPTLAAAGLLPWINDTAYALGTNPGAPDYANAFAAAGPIAEAPGVFLLFAGGAALLALASRHLIPSRARPSPAHTGGEPA